MNWNHRASFVGAALIALASCTKPDSPTLPQATSITARAVEHGRLAEVNGCTIDTPLVDGVPGSPGHYIKSSINPNGHSELAFLMREMQAELGEVRPKVLAGEAVDLSFKHHRIRCAWPTSMSDHNPAFDAMAVNYLQAVDRFNAAGTPSKEDFDGVVDTCLACHANTCAGPIVAIRPLRIDAPGEGAGHKGMFE